MFSFYKVILDLLKARTHKYVRRVPIGATQTGGTKYKYYYQEQAGHGKGLGHESELVKDASFSFGEGENKYHAHIKSVDGDKLTIEYDDGDKKGTKETLSKTEFQNRIHKEHATSIERSHERAKKQLATFQQMKEKGHKVKDSTLNKLKAQVEKLDSLKKKPEAPQAPKKPIKETSKKTPAPSKTNDSLDPINATKDNIGMILKANLLDFTSEDEALHALMGVNVNLIDKRFEATNRNVLGVLAFPEGMNFKIKGNNKYEQGTCIMSKELVTKYGDSNNVSLEFDTDTYEITLRNKDNEIIAQEKSLYKTKPSYMYETKKDRRGYTDIQDRYKDWHADAYTDIKYIYEESQRTKESFAKIEFSQADIQTLKKIKKAGINKQECKLKVEIKDNKLVLALDVDGLFKYPKKYEDIKRKYRIDSNKIEKVLISGDSIITDNTYNSEDILVYRSKKTNEILSILNLSVESGELDDKPEEIKDFIKNSSYMGATETPIYPINIPLTTSQLNIKNRRDTSENVRFIKYDYFQDGVSKAPILSLGHFQGNPYVFDNGKNMEVIAMGLRG